MISALSPQGWTFLIGGLLVLCTVSTCLLAIAGYKLTTRSSKRYPAHEPERMRSPREPEIDLAKERYDFQARRDSYLEDRALRRIA